ncbi:MAG: leucine-rich repeat domain-containing protein [Pseudomonadota bacterium]
MSDADDAFRRAEAKVATCNDSQVTRLDLDGDRGFSELRELPASITSLSDLRVLTLTGTQVDDLSPLAGLTELREVYLSNTAVQDISPLKDLVALRLIWLEGTRVTELSPLRGMSRLQTLGLRKTPVQDFAPLSALSALVSLGLSQTAFSDTSVLSGLAQLKRLYLKETRVSDLAPLSMLKDLRRLSLDQTSANNLSQLAELSRLERLYLTNSRVMGLSFIRGLQRLERLYLAFTNVTDLRPLADLTQLSFLDITGIEAEDLTPLSSILTLLQSPREGGLAGLRFAGAGAVRRDRVLNEISKISNDAERTRRVLDYLRERSGLPAIEPRPVTTKQASGIFLRDRAQILLRTAASTHVTTTVLVMQIEGVIADYLQATGRNQLPDELSIFDDLLAALRTFAQSPALSEPDRDDSIGQLVQNLARLEAQVAELATALAEAIAQNEADADQTERAAFETSERTFSTAFLKELGAETAGLVTWTCKMGVLTGCGYLLGSSPAASALARALEASMPHLWR